MMLSDWTSTARSLSATFRNKWSENQISYFYQQLMVPAYSIQHTVYYYQEYLWDSDHGWSGCGCGSRGALKCPDGHRVLWTAHCSHPKYDTSDIVLVDYLDWI